MEKLIVPAILTGLTVFLLIVWIPVLREARKKKN